MYLQIPLGKAEVKAIFGSGKKKVAGCMITQGKVQKVRSRGGQNVVVLTLV